MPLHRVYEHRGGGARGGRAPCLARIRAGHNRSAHPRGPVAIYPAPFDYAAPATLEEAIALLREGRGSAKLLAGGHSLIPLLKLRLAAPHLLVDLGRIAGLRFIREDPDAMVIGAMATYRDVLSNEPIGRRLSVVAEAVRRIGDAQVRARGTPVGSLAHNDPAADLPAVMLALDASVMAAGPEGARTIRVEDLLGDMMTTSLNDNEILSELRVPYLAERTAASYVKIDQPASGYALAGVCAVIGLDAVGRIAAARVAVTGVGSKAYRVPAVEGVLVGTTAMEGSMSASLAFLTDGIDVLEDMHASGEYRAHIARVCARRALREAFERARA